MGGEFRGGGPLGRTTAPTFSQNIAVAYTSTAQPHNASYYSHTAQIGFDSQCGDGLAGFASSQTPAWKRWILIGWERCFTKTPLTFLCYEIR